MNIASENAVTAGIILIALGILAIGYYRTRPYGKMGLLSWLQSVALMTPWLLFFALLATGVYINLVGVIALVAASAGAYMFLGNRLRSLSQDPAQQEEVEKILLANRNRKEKAEVTDAANTDPIAAPILTEPTVSPEDLQAMQSIFGVDTFFATESIPYQDGAYFKGNLRGDAEVVYTRLAGKLEERLGDRFRLYMLASPEGKPLVLILPGRNDPQPLTVQQNVLVAVLAIATVATTLGTGAILMGFDLFSNLDRLSEVLPIAVGLWVVLLAHEFGHQWMAGKRQVRFSWPFFLPTWQIGSFGALNRFESAIPDRKVLFDVAFAGPAAGVSISLAMAIVGFYLSHSGSLFQIPSLYFKGSLLVGTIAKAILGTALEGEIVGVHPLAIVGWLGLVINALNLMPAGTLDGGRIVQAIYGRKTTGRTTIATIIVLGLVSFINPLALYWAALILILQRDLERPSLNELVEPDDTRAALALLALLLAIVTLIPLSPSVAGTLGIGG
jgi:membrane-associated protease RseP (regulator of RpoE activity)